jgi:hypothetical protein
MSKKIGIERRWMITAFMKQLEDPVQITRFIFHIYIVLALMHSEKLAAMFQIMNNGFKCFEVSICCEFFLLDRRHNKVSPQFLS